ncbi:hypothetical protein [Lentibacillus sp. CBA3610]|uniref:hypothetical protein n=1 Tax=Lentibacillus sp. CBA3610 TaxID=2518176 RepID=UPI0015950C81|nr:hypothetical protein [Lentibacillus sp. CBA3610]QKY70205.1 hypothetical protein Len3610_11920 [Lentibacillus sp. CBA3610]
MNNIQMSRPNELVYICLKWIIPTYVGLDIPTAQLNRERRKVSEENTSSILPEVIFDPSSGHYLLAGGYTTFYAYQLVHNPNTLVPCKVFYQLTEDERYLLTLDWMLKNNITNWYNRHDIITKLMRDFRYTLYDLNTFLKRPKKTIQRYLDPPPHIDRETIRQQKESIINKIDLEALKHEHNKDYLYILILYFGLHISDDQLKYLRWIRGNDIKFEECRLTLEQEQQLIDKALNLKQDFLEQIRSMINDMRIENGDGSIF